MLFRKFRHCFGYAKNTTEYMSINVHIYQSEFKNESRMLRITDSLARLNFFSEIIIFAVYSDGLLEHESLGKSRYVYRIKTFINPKGSTFLGISFS